MATSVLTARIDDNIKTQFQDICTQIGLNPSQAIKLFAMAVINNNTIPFELRAKTSLMQLLKMQCLN